MQKSSEVVDRKHDGSQFEMRDSPRSGLNLGGLSARISHDVISDTVILHQNSAEPILRRIRLQRGPSCGVEMSQDRGANKCIPDPQESLLATGTPLPVFIRKQVSKGLDN